MWRLDLCGFRALWRSSRSPSASRQACTLKRQIPWRSSATGIATATILIPEKSGPWTKQAAVLEKKIKGMPMGYGTSYYYSYIEEPLTLDFGQEP